jgi:hypothetical protein
MAVVPPCSCSNGGGGLPEGGDPLQILITDTNGDAVWGSAPYVTYIYNSSGTQQGNRYNNWQDMFDAMALVEGPKSVLIEQPETVPAGAWDFSNITFLGNGNPFSMPVEFTDGVTITSMVNCVITQGIIFWSSSSSPIYIAENTVIAIARASAISSTNAPFIFVPNTTSFFVIGVTDGSAIASTTQVGIYGGVPVVEIEDGFAGFLAYSMSGNTPSLADDVFVSSATTLVRLIQSVVINLNEGILQPQMGGGVFDQFFTDASALRYSNVVSGLVADDVQAAIDELAASPAIELPERVIYNVEGVVSANTVLTDAGTIVLYDAAAAPFTITIPEVSGDGDVVILKEVNGATGTVTVDTIDASLIDNALTINIGLTPYESVKLVGAQGAWWRV